MRKVLMTRVATFAVIFALAASTTKAWSQTADASPFPFEQWKAAILAQDAATLKNFYSTDPAAQVRVNSVMHDSDADTSFWLGLKPRSIDVEVVRNTIRHGHYSFIFRARVLLPNGQTLNITDDQSWQRQGGVWRLIAVERSDAPKLRQPSSMAKNIYPADADAHAEIREAEERAARSGKRLLLVFGANWCFDCHVLDLAFQSPELAPAVVANYEVVHVDLGPEEEKNADLVAQYEIPLKKGIPALAVADSDGKLVVSQKNGEFEDARVLTPEVLAEFLNKWKPARID
jgi:thioredoxin 1